MAITCPKCGKLNPDNARFCFNDGEKLVTTGFTPFQFTNGTSANSIEDLIILIEQNWDESKRYLYSDSFATWFSSIGRGDLTLAAQDIVQSTQDQDTALRKIIRRMEKNSTFRFSDGNKASTISEFVTTIDQNWDEGKRYLYNHDDLADWLETIQKDDLAKTARQIISIESDQDIGLEKFLQSLGSDAPPKPQLTATTATIDFGTIDADKVSKGSYTKQFTISNSGRGYLYGTVSSSGAWVSIDKTGFSGNSITITATAKAVGRNANIKIQSNGGTETLPVQMNPVYPIWKPILSLECLIGAVVGLGLDYLVAYLFLILAPNPIRGIAMGLSFGLALSMSKWARKIQRPIFYLIPAALIMLGIGILTNLGYQEQKIRTAKNSDVWAVEPLTNALKGKSSNVRRDAADTLGMIGDARAVQPLINILKDNNAEVQKRATDALGKIGKPAVEPLINTLKDNNVEARKNAADALGKIGDARSIEPLVNALKDRDSYVRSHAATSLGRIGDARAVEPLINVLKDESWSVRHEAASALEQIGDARAEVPLLLYGLSKDSGAAVEALAEIGVSAVEPLINALKDEDRDMRANAAAALGYIGDEKALQPLIGALGDEDTTVRLKAVRALRLLNDPKAVPSLTGLLKVEEEKHVLKAVIFTLTEIGDVRAVQPLSKLVNDSLKKHDDDAAEVCDSAIRALGEIGDAIATTALIRALSDGWRVERVGVLYSDIPVEAAKALGKLRSSEAVQPLIKALRARLMVRREAAEALGKIGNTRAINPLIQAFRYGGSKDPASNMRYPVAIALAEIGKPAVPALLNALSHKDKDVQPGSAVALGQIGDKRAVQPLMDVLRDGEQYWFLRSNAAEALGRIGDKRAVSVLIGALKDDNSSVRSAAAEALGKLGDARATTPLFSALNDEDNYVRWRAACALGRIGDERATSLLTNMWSTTGSYEHKDIAAVLGQIGDTSAVELLVRALGDEEEYSSTREVIANALADAGDKRAVPVLIDIWEKDDDRRYISMRLAAAEALGKLGDARAINPLINALKDESEYVPQRVIQALHNIGGPAVPALISALKGEKWYVRKRVVGVLGRIEDTRAIEPLTNALKDPNGHVRKAAREALKKIQKR